MSRTVFIMSNDAEWWDDGPFAVFTTHEAAMAYMAKIRGWSGAPEGRLIEEVALDPVHPDEVKP